MCPDLGEGISQEGIGILCSGLYGKLIQMVMSECQQPPQFTLEYTHPYTPCFISCPSLTLAWFWQGYR